MSIPKVDHSKTARIAWSIPELASALGTGYDTVHRAIKAGRVEAFKLFGVGEWRVSAFEVARVIGVPVADLDGLLAEVVARRAKRT